MAVEAKPVSEPCASTESRGDPDLSLDQTFCILRATQAILIVVCLRDDLTLEGLGQLGCVLKSHVTLIRLILQARRRAKLPVTNSTRIMRFH